MEKLTRLFYAPFLWGIVLHFIPPHHAINPPKISTLPGQIKAIPPGQGKKGPGSGLSPRGDALTASVFAPIWPAAPFSSFGQRMKAIHYHSSYTDTGNQYVFILEDTKTRPKAKRRAWKPQVHPGMAPEELPGKVGAA